MAKKAQAALEFLMTYGWAFLVILILIGALSYFGVLNPTKFLPAKCTFSPEIKCTDYKVGYDGTDVTLNLKLSNGLSETVKVMEVDIQEVEDGPRIVCTTALVVENNAANNHDYAAEGSISADAHIVDPNGAVLWASGSTVTVRGQDCAFNSITAGRKQKVLATVTYFDAKLVTFADADDFSHSVRGEVFADVQTITP